jgi:hypothetical protein
MFTSALTWIYGYISICFSSTVCTDLINARLPIKQEAKGRAYNFVGVYDLCSTRRKGAVIAGKPNSVAPTLAVIGIN